MSDNLSHFLVDLASSPDQMRAFLADPSRVLDGTSLSPGEKAAVLARDGAQIRAALGEKTGPPTGATTPKTGVTAPKTGAKKKKTGGKSKKSSKKK